MGVMFQLKIIVALILIFSAMGFSQTTSDANIEFENVFGRNGTTSLKFLPDGSILLIEKLGVLLYRQSNGDGSFEDGVEVIDLRNEVSTDVESGLLGLEVDPDFANSPYVYLFYTTPTEQKLVRYTLNAEGSAVEAGSELELLTGLPREAEFHNAGDIRFSPHDPGHLFVCLGDDGIPNNAQDMNLYHGKILRVKKSDGMAPEDNPHFDGDANSVTSRIWASGFRNQWRIVFTQSLPGVAFLSENGGPDGMRESEDRVTRVTAGGNCSWSQAAHDAGADSEWYTTPDEGCTFLVSTAPSAAGIAVADRGGFAPDVPMLYWGKAFNRGILQYAFTDETMSAVVPVSGGEPVLVGDETSVHFEWAPDGSLYSTASGVGGAEGAWQQTMRFNYVGPAISVMDVTPTPEKSRPRLTLPWLDYSRENVTAQLHDILGRNAHRTRSHSVVIQSEKRFSP